MRVPYNRPQITQDEINEVVACLTSGWLTTGPRVKRFEDAFASYIGVKHAVALNSATAALHLALEAIGLRRGEAVLVPTMTFASTAEVVRYFDAIPVLVDCRESDFNIDVDDARSRAIATLNQGKRLRAIIPVHYGGQVADMTSLNNLADEFGLSVIEDSAHCCPGFYRHSVDSPWKPVGSHSDVACFSFYANKCITTGEGGMACTNSDQLAERIRIMSLHGLSKDAWKRFSAEGTWHYEIVAPGFKYNLSDIAAAIGIHQLRKADIFREERRRIAARYRELLCDLAEIILPEEASNRIHSWHLFVIRLRLERLTLDRAAVVEELRSRGIGTSVHWIPLHMHPYYRNYYGYRVEDLPVAARLSKEILSLPIFPDMVDTEIAYVADMLRDLLAAHRK